MSRVLAAVVESGGQGVKVVASSGPVVSKRWTAIRESGAVCS